MELIETLYDPLIQGKGDLSLRNLNRLKDRSENSKGNFHPYPMPKVVEHQEQLRMKPFEMSMGHDELHQKHGCFLPKTKQVIHLETALVAVHLLP